MGHTGWKFKTNQHVGLGRPRRAYLLLGKHISMLQSHQKKIKLCCSVSTLKHHTERVNFLVVNQKWYIKFSGMQPLQNKIGKPHTINWSGGVWPGDGLSPREDVLQRLWNTWNTWLTGRTPSPPWVPSITGSKEVWKAERETTSSNRTWSVHIHSVQETVTGPVL